MRRGGEGGGDIRTQTRRDTRSDSISAMRICGAEAADCWSAIRCSLSPVCMHVCMCVCMYHRARRFCRYSTFESMRGSYVAGWEGICVACPPKNKTTIHFAFLLRFLVPDVCMYVNRVAGSRGRCMCEVYMWGILIDLVTITPPLLSVPTSRPPRSARG